MHWPTLLGIALVVVSGCHDFTVFKVPNDPRIGAFQAIGGLTRARARATAERLGDSFYVLAGQGPGETTLGDAERATIQPTGVLGPFEATPLSGATPRYRHASFVVPGKFLYLIGGIGPTGAAAIERAPISPAGTLGPFTPAGELTPTRASFGLVVAGDPSSGPAHVYLLGGLTPSVTDEVLEAPLDGDGILGPFVTSPNLRLADPRCCFGMVASGTHLYVLGGYEVGNELSSIEVSEIDASQGTLGAFQSLDGIMLSAGRDSSASVTIGRYLYLFGGNNSVRDFDIPDRATLDGVSLTSALVPDETAKLLVARSHPIVFHTDRFVYVIGGRITPTAEYVATAEAAPIVLP
jgi:hypothetical protein